MSAIEGLRRRRHRFRIGPSGKLLHRGPRVDVGEIRRLESQIRAELEAERAQTGLACELPGPGTGEVPAAATDPHARPGELGDSLPARRVVRQTWTEETRELIRWFGAAEHLPAVTFTLGPALRVTDPARFYDFLRRWIAEADASPHPGLTANLRRLREIVTKAQDGS